MTTILKFDKIISLIISENLELSEINGEIQKL
jgi:hypothetical protein